jgi:hypothetical protein
MQKRFVSTKNMMVLAVSLLVILPACWKSEKSSESKALNDGSPAMLTVDGKTLITEKSFRDYFNNLLASNQNPQLQMMLQLLPNAKQELFKGQVNEKMICYWAEKEGITQSDEYKEKFAQGLEVLKVGLAAEFFKKEFASDLTVTDEESQNFYEAHKDSQYLMAPKADGKAAQYYSYDQVKQHIEQQIQNEKLAKLFIQKLGELKDKYAVVENTASLNAVSEAEEAKAEEEIAQVLSQEGLDDMSEAASDLAQEDISSEELPAQSL